MPKSVYDEAIKEWKSIQKDKPFIRMNAEWRRIWRNAGPVEFAEKVLKIDPNTGGQLILSDGQKEFLNDLAFNGVRLAIIAAGRGSGKTFVLAVYITWRIFTHDNWGISTMGGSKEQSDKIHSYIVGWIRTNEDLYNYSRNMVSKNRVATVSNGEVTFHSCSATSVRGPHTVELAIDEESAGEERGGTKNIMAAIWEVSTSPDIHIIKSSTIQYVHGDFLKTWNDAEKLGYKRYRWSIAKHVSNEDPYKVYQDTNPKNWVSCIPWIPDLNIQILRENKSNDEWLVEALGGISITSGLAFNPNDIKSCICDKCEICYPYKEDYCPVIQYYLQLEGVLPSLIPISTLSALQRYIKERIEGIDWGRVSPCAYTAVGRYLNVVFVLISKEIIGLSDKEKIETAIEVAEQWNCDIIRPDPREWAYNNSISERGKFSVQELWKGVEGGGEKDKYIYTLKRYIERHQLIIPKAYEDLIRSLLNLSYDQNGKIRKQDDHSFDSLLYGVSYYGSIANQASFWKVIRESQPESSRGKIEVVPEERELSRDFEEEMRKKHPKEEELKNPYEGVNLWGNS